MKATEKRPFSHAMAFYHEDGLPAAWQQATKFAGKDGRLATMPDIVAARLASKPDDAPWETWYTTLTAEYYGLDRSGRLILVVAHGIGPMSTLDGVLKVYGWEYKDKERSHHGGRISQQEFWDLADGKFGEVAIIDYESYCRRYKYPFIQVLRSSEALIDPVLKARLGPQAEEYVRAHTAYAKEWHREQAGIVPENKHETPARDFQKFVARRQNLHEGAASGTLDPYIIQLGDAANCSYFGNRCRIPEKGYALGHLISTGRLVHLHHEGHESLTLDIDCHEWGNGVRLVGVRAGGNVRSGVQAGPDAHKLLRKHWRDLLVPMKKSESMGFHALVRLGDQWFTQYPKKGERMDTGEPEFVVTSLKKVGNPVVFRTTVGGYYGFFKFGISEVQAIAPPQANAYLFVGEPENEWHDGNPTHQTCPVQFYRIEADVTKRLMRSDQLARNYDLMMELMAK
jgi:hypothetical protein